MAGHGRASKGALPFLAARKKRHRATRRQPGEEERKMKVSFSGSDSLVPLPTQQSIRSLVLQ